MSPRLPACNPRPTAIGTDGDVCIIILLYLWCVLLLFLNAQCVWYQTCTPARMEEGGRREERREEEEKKEEEERNCVYGWINYSYYYSHACTFPCSIIIIIILLPS